MDECEICKKTGVQLQKVSVKYLDPDGDELWQNMLVCQQCANELEEKDFKIDDNMG